MTSDNDVVIVSAVRTAIGAFNGALSSLPAHMLGETVLRETLKRTSVSAADISEVILGQILTAHCGPNPARIASLAAGIPKETPAWGMNQLCGSGLRAVCLGFQAIKNGDSSVVIAGGQESMSQAPHAVPLRSGVKMGPATMQDTMLYDALVDPFQNVHMGVTAENVARKFGITREEQDKFALASQQKASAAIKEGKFKDQIAPVVIKGKKGDVTVDTDECPRADTTLEGLAKLRPAFEKEGTVTAGNASGINDGAAVVMLMTRADANKRGLKPMAAIKAWAHAGVDPAIMGTGPIPATRRALEKAGWKVGDLDLIEANEAFAAQAIAVNRDLGWDLSNVNVNGGAIALGHPVGASGARVLTTLLYSMQERDAKRGLATLCIGGGMGVAMCVER
ncbi:MAG: acetyl-CoA C-acetyltransferase [Pseudomonadota bacterium]|nr:acetyl-CoA C-acetyltransferase [Pseudomonadota bacterium]MDE3037903.1 acetyl-CoA C-acetyltransferase [Pseudomonadota bacterium]